MKVPDSEPSYLKESFFKHFGEEEIIEPSPNSPIHAKEGPPLHTESSSNKAVMIADRLKSNKIEPNDKSLKSPKKADLSSSKTSSVSFTVVTTTLSSKTEKAAAKTENVAISLLQRFLKALGFGPKQKTIEETIERSISAPDPNILPKRMPNNDQERLTFARAIIHHVYAKKAELPETELVNILKGLDPVQKDILKEDIGKSLIALDFDLDKAFNIIELPPLEVTPGTSIAKSASSNASSASEGTQELLNSFEKMQWPGQYKVLEDLLDAEKNSEKSEEKGKNWNLACRLYSKLSPAFQKDFIFHLISKRDSFFFKCAHKIKADSISQQVSPKESQEPSAVLSPPISDKMMSRDKGPASELSNEQIKEKLKHLNEFNITEGTLPAVFKNPSKADVMGLLNYLDTEKPETSNKETRKIALLAVRQFLKLEKSTQDEIADAIKDKPTYAQNLFIHSMVTDVVVNQAVMHIPKDELETEIFFISKKFQKHWQT